ncbi:hypothetical protein D6D29_10495 [Aureobasidium pullulans]|nr:hypothetical protein D6D29_10495 [Aureobasidium pullulans]
MNESLCQRHNNGKRQWSHGLALSPVLTSSGTSNVQNLRPWTPLCATCLATNNGRLPTLVARSRLHETISTRKPKLPHTTTSLASLSSWKTPSYPSPALSTTLNVTNYKLAPPDEQPPMLLRHEQRGLDFSNLAQLLQRSQLQKCSNTYCLCENKRTGIVSCRSHLSHDLRDQGSTCCHQEPQRSAAHLMFYPGCNDPHLNCYNRAMSLGRLANTNITPCTSLQALLNHLSEYCTKAGVRDPQY